MAVLRRERTMLLKTSIDTKVEKSEMMNHLIWNPLKRYMTKVKLLSNVQV